jgi:Mn2+/Fe2+ NRAMP family transporter
MFKFIKKLGPGLLFAGAAIGVSHLVQSTKAGADFGFGLVWALLLAHFCKYPFFQFGPRYAAATGESLLEGYQKMSKNALRAYFVLTFATMFTIQAAVTIVTAGLAANLFGSDASILIWSLLVTAVAFLLLTLGKYKLLDNLIKYIVLVLALTTFIAVSIAFKNHTQTIHFRQIIPQGALEIGFLIAFMGWMPGPLDISVWQSLWTVEKQKETKTTLKQTLLDFNIGYAATLSIGLCFVALGCFVFYGSGDTFEGGAVKFSQQLVSMYTKNLGPSSYWIIAFAALTTMFSTSLTTLDASPRSMLKATELLGKRNYKYGYWFWISFLAIGTLCILLFFKSEMAWLIKIATILSFLSAPFYAILNLALICSKHTPKEARPSLFLISISVLGIIFLIGFGIWFVVSRF